MSVKIALTHKTHYKYDRPVQLSPHIIRLRPAPHSRTPIEAYSLKITPENHFINWQQDPFGNYLARVVFPEKTEELGIDVEIIADMVTINPFDFFLDEDAQTFPFSYKTSLKRELAPYLEIREEGKLLRDFLKTIDLEPKTTNDFLVYLNQKLNAYLNYTIRMEPGVQSCEVTLGNKLGSCRDYAWLFVQVLRHLGLAARFVSGYLVQLAPDEKPLEGPEGPEQDFTDLHAWTEVYLPGAGWVGLDATSGLFAGEGHIPLACTPSPESAHAIEGFVDRKCETEFSYENRVERIFESPRVTKPYKEEQWEAIRRLGFHVDKDLSEGDVRLTMGGEPTFVSIDDMEAPEWNTEADGPHKRALADTLSRRLMERFGPGGFLHHAQGKWYPGEPLPRWKTTIYWRKDGKPIWRDHTYLSGLHEHHDYTTEDAKRFLSTLSLALGVSEQNISPAYEDAFYYAYKESQLPPDVDPLDVDLDDDLERRTLAEVLKKGLGNPVGYVLPLGWGTTRWITSKWEFRRKHLFLLPGNSPIGLRLPLDSLTAKPHIELEKNFEPDLFADYPQLGDYHASAEARLLAASPETTPNRRYEAFVRTGICAEVREDRLYLFLPPIEKTEAYLDLIASIEVTARTLDMRVVLEGYEPPTDNRIEKISVTPDPGVIEVNIHPADSWQMLLENTHTLYEEAKLSRLGTEKFMIDGRHTGTGGGNHVTLGGRKPSDSPLLRRPDLLRSLITFWQHHPGLSYLFSGAFIGPTSQAPRVDEGRMENLYDLEIAFDQIPENQPVPYWLTDRLFRNFLTDITGNTHRSEFCIDKLYSPDSPTGRLGLLELRAFDMPPHYQMSLLQMLLVRALVAAFWKNPYKHPLVRWGTQLHDKYLLEHYVREDIASVVDYLNSAGYAFETSWFDPFFEFRFPTFGMPVIEGMRFELRGAIEPWHVLGEESTGQGTSRYVDSSMERIQLKVSDFVSERYIVACNGVKVPLAETDTKGVYTAGVRYKAWKPWSALHPTIDIDAPLVFDVVDTWNNRSIGGFTYFVTHPGGRSYDTFPVNVLEAESRRVNRFWEQGHSQGPVVPESMQPPAPFVSAPEAPSIGAVREVVNTGPEKGFRLQEVPISREYPHTLDLRRKKR